MSDQDYTDLDAVRDYIRTHEFCDSWNVPSIYTPELRKLLGMEESSL